MATQSCQDNVDSRIALYHLSFGCQFLEWEEGVILCVGDTADGVVSFDSVGFDCCMTRSQGNALMRTSCRAPLAHRQPLGRAERNESICLSPSAKRNSRMRSQEKRVSQSCGSSQGNRMLESQSLCCCKNSWRCCGRSKSLSGSSGTASPIMHPSL